MKRIILCVIVCLILCLCGCARKIVYETKYIDNCVSTEFRQKPSNEAPVLGYLERGEICSFERDAKNGYSKIVHNGVVGYVLSTTLSDEEPAVENKDVVEENVENETEDYTKKSEHMISNMESGSIEEYISAYVRPLYNKINSNIDNFSKNTLGNATVWYDNGKMCKKELLQSDGNYGMARQYYYDVEKGKMVFAFIFAGTRENRLYFKDNKLIRHIDESGKVINNPTSVESMKMAEIALGEAY